MRRELGIARCGLACCLCSENEHCGGCDSGDCPDTGWCENQTLWIYIVCEKVRYGSLARLSGGK